MVDVALKFVVVVDTLIHELLFLFQFVHEYSHESSFYNKDGRKKGTKDKERMETDNESSSTR
jgi:hypothetical protein